MLYVDDGHWPLGRMKMSHMIADTPEELRQAARSLNLGRYIQYAGTWKEHLDVSRTKRQQAIDELGANQVTGRRIVEILRKRREEEERNNAPGNTP